MKKILTFALAFALFIAVPLAAAANTFTDGFDPRSVIDGMLTNINQSFNGSVTCQESESAGNYEFLYEGQNIGAYLFIAHYDKEGNSSQEGVMNHIAFSLAFTYDESTAQVFLAFWLAFSAALMQYLDGGDNIDLYTPDLSDALKSALNDNMTYQFSFAGYDMEVEAIGYEGVIILGTVVSIPGLY